MLDCGRGDGANTIKVAERIGTTDISGVEAYEPAARKASGRDIKITAADLNEPLPIDDGTFEGVFAKEMLEHLSNTDSFIREVLRILKTGGCFLASIPNLATWQTIFVPLLGKQPPPTEASDEVHFGKLWFYPNQGTILPEIVFCHWRIFTADALEGLLKYHMFRVEEMARTDFHRFSLRCRGSCVLWTGDMPCTSLQRRKME